MQCRQLLCGTKCSVSSLTPRRPAGPHAGRGNRLCGNSYPPQHQRLTGERDEAATSPRARRRPAEAPPTPGAGVGQGHTRYNIPPLSTLGPPEAVSIKCQVRAAGHRPGCPSILRQFAGDWRTEGLLWIPSNRSPDFQPEARAVVVALRYVRGVTCEGKRAREGMWSYRSAQCKPFRSGG